MTKVIKQEQRISLMLKCFEKGQTIHKPYAHTKNVYLLNINNHGVEWFLDDVIVRHSSQILCLMLVKVISEIKQHRIDLMLLFD